MLMWVSPWLRFSTRDRHRHRFRRNTVITAALQLAAWIFDKGQESHKETIQQLVEHGLRYLAQELRYDREPRNPDEIPRKRLYCAELAAAMAKMRTR